MPRGSQEKESKKNPLSFVISKVLRINVVYLLGFLLIVASFLIGVLITKVSYLENNSGGIVTTTGTDDTDTPTQPVGPVDVDMGHLPVLGNKDAKVEIVEFSDFQCPFCKSLFDDTLSQIKSEYVDTGKVKFAYRQFPLTSIHPNAQGAAEASECANEQGKFWEYHDTLFTNQADWESLTSTDIQNKYVEYAGNLGLDTNKFSSCIISNKYADKVKEDLDEGTKIGVDGTPATFINGIRISGAVPFADFKAEIEKALGN